MICPLKILLVEDNPAQARLLQELFKCAQLSQHRLVTVQRLKIAFEQLQKESYDAILLDLNLPDAQGMDTLAQLLQKIEGQPIVVLSNSSDQQLAQTVKQHGAKAYLDKRQLSPQLLAQILSRVLGDNACLP